jgi:hypothetical protein
VKQRVRQDLSVKRMGYGIPTRGQLSKSSHVVFSRISIIAEGAS